MLELNLHHRKVLVQPLYGHRKEWVNASKIFRANEAEQKIDSRDRISTFRVQATRLLRLFHPLLSLPLASPRYSLQR
jgi:hypothetical protein